MHVNINKRNRSTKRINRTNTIKIKTTYIYIKEKKRIEEEAAHKRLPMLARRQSQPRGPLTPQGRPVVLPGGRMWRNERDAFNEDFIAEVISSQAELIAGNALG